MLSQCWQGNRSKREFHGERSHIIDKDSCSGDDLNEKAFPACQRDIGFSLRICTAYFIRSVRPLCLEPADLYRASKSMGADEAFWSGLYYVELHRAFMVKTAPDKVCLCPYNSSDNICDWFVYRTLHVLAFRRMEAACCDIYLPDGFRIAAEYNIPFRKMVRDTFYSTDYFIRDDILRIAVLHFLSAGYAVLQDVVMTGIQFFCKESIEGGCC